VLLVVVPLLLLPLFPQPVSLLLLLCELQWLLPSVVVVCSRCCSC
jgi:hypothetical protein